LRTLLSPAELDDTLVATLARCRRLDPIRRLYAMCQASRLLPPDQALALVEEAIAGLPPDHGWVHFPGGLMLMLLGEPVIDALDRDGLREHLIAWADREGPDLTENLLDGYAERLDELRLGSPPALDRAPERRGRELLDAASSGDLSALLDDDAALPDALLGEAITVLQAAVREHPEEPWRTLVLARLAVRARALGQPCSAAAFAQLDEQVTRVRWDRYSYPQPIWRHPEFAELPAGLRARVLGKALVDLRESASMVWLEREIATVDRLLDAEPARASASSATELGARWLAGACVHLDVHPNRASERWEAARELWGREGLDALRRALGA
jgi:hypothetical protein